MHNAWYQGIGCPSGVLTRHLLILLKTEKIKIKMSTKIGSPIPSPRIMPLLSVLVVGTGVEVSEIFGFGVVIGLGAVVGVVGLCVVIVVFIVAVVVVVGLAICVVPGQ